MDPDAPASQRGEPHSQRWTRLARVRDAGIVRRDTDLVEMTRSDRGIVEIATTDGAQLGTACRPRSAGLAFGG
jgi:hypothetical protein